MRSVASPSHSSSVGPQRCQASAASSHCWRVVVLYRAGSKPIGSSSFGTSSNGWAPDRRPIAEGFAWHFARRQRPRREATMSTMSGRSGAGDLVGRAPLLNRLGSLVGRARSGRRVTVLVTGEAGVGKTSLLRAVVATAAGEGARIGWGTCLDLAGAPGYWPWTQAIDGLVRSIGTDRARRSAGDDASLLATIVPALGEASPGPRRTDRPCPAPALRCHHPVARHAGVRTGSGCRDHRPC